MKLYYAPGVCSIGIHVLLEEIGKPYDLELVNLREGAQYQPQFTGVNPKSKVPTLQRDDGSILTEFPVIARWLARQNPQANLIPKDEEADTRAACRERARESEADGRLADAALAARNREDLHR